MQDDTRIPIETQVACVKREIAMRLKVYPRLVKSGKMTQAEVDQELAEMGAVLKTLEPMREQADMFRAPDDA